MKNMKIIGMFIFTMVLVVGCKPSKVKDGYLFVYFTGNGPDEEALHYAISEDGYNYRALNGNKPVVDSKQIGSTGGVRDPHILRGEDGKTFYMVQTDLYVPEMGWKNYAMVLMKSTDLIHWESSIVNIPETFSKEFGDVWRVWAPQTIYDEETGKYMIYFSMKQGDDPDKIYYAYANDDFSGLESAPKQLYFPPVESNNKACIDGDILYKDGRYHLFHKAEDGEPGIKLAVSSKLTEGYTLVSNQRVDKEIRPVEGSGVFKLNNEEAYILMYDVYSSGKYQFAKSRDLENFEVVDQHISMNFHPRHGTVLPISGNEMVQLIKHFKLEQDLLVDFTNSSIKQMNVKSDEAHIHIPVKRNADITAFDPQITSVFSFVDISPKGSQDFSKGAIDYTFTIGSHETIHYSVEVSNDNNPVLEGYYADPEVLYSEKTGKYYIYPTSDGFHKWSGYYFKVFSSDNLVDWTDEGIMLDLKKDVSWANRNAWAPCIIEKKIKGEYKYFYYFTAAQKVGVAVADHPAGPFVDSGKALVDFKPFNVKGGQEIDPDVFTDPVSGKSYLYWGNGHLAVVELNDDMISFKESTMKLITPDRTFREGAYVIYRQGIYYFMWCEDDTRSPNYKVRYATAKSPMGPLEIPENNIVIMRDDEAEILGTGHNSVIQVPGKDEWYIVYHRFNYPKGKEMGRSAGYHREVCIDPLTFDEKGYVIQVKPTLKGIEPLND